jgi:hypothetical protein
LSTLGKMDISMEQFNLNYSHKNIPTASHSTYLKCLIEKTEHFIRRMRWKALYFLNPDLKDESKETFGFKSKKTPPVIPEMKNFEEKMLKIVKTVKFENNSNNFQQKLKKDVESIKSSDRLIVKADKTTNLYKMQKCEYNELLNNNVTKVYKKASKELMKDINKGDKRIAENLGLDDRMEIMAEKEAFITLKDHKPNFVNKPTCRLINPTKSELGHVSKAILERIISKIVTATNINLWRNTSSVLDWFKTINNKEKASFISFDIIDFYPSITEKLLKKALEYADQFDQITEEEKNIIMHAKKTITCNNSTTWQKKQSNGSFDVTMGSFDGAETCELIVCYLLSILSKKYGKSIGLYRDDGLGIFHEKPQIIEKIKKDICSIFKENNLKITIEANKKVVNFLDVTLDLTRGKHKPHMKPGNTPLYVHSKSNHPPNILKNIPKGINKRLTEISSDAEVFTETVEQYQEALNNSGYKHNLTYLEKEKSNKKRTRSRNILWYNPPYDMQVKTNIGREFLKAVENTFTVENPLRKIFNRNTLKISYSCMPNMGKIINKHNMNILKPTKADNKNSTTEVMCNCRKKVECPLKGKCLSKDLVYQAMVKTVEKTEYYVGLTATTFKSRYNNHIASFRNESQRYATELSKYIWCLKDQNTNFTLSWNILCHAMPYSNISKRCNLCTTEKYFILCKPNMSTLNSRQEIVSKCRHASKYLLMNN